jgi:hypothetical protein
MQNDNVKIKIVVSCGFVLLGTFFHSCHQRLQKQTVQKFTF